MKISRRTALALTAAAPVALATSARAASHAAHEVVIKGFAFSPAELDVQAGQAVRFVNNDNAPHTGTAADGSFDTGALQPGDTVEVEIPAGNHAFVCRFHPKMKGVIRAS
ncbi:MAG: cupredoxin domain-containing protein [Paracoccaceae bacterium]